MDLEHAHTPSRTESIMQRDAVFHQPANIRMQAPAGGAAVLSSRVGRAPAAPDAERWADQE
jgi:hypothetical protein